MKSNKSRLAVVLLSAFIGLLGVHRMYVGKYGTGTMQLIMTLSGVGMLISAIWVFIDFILAVIGRFRDSEGKLVTDWITE